VQRYQAELFSVLSSLPRDLTDLITNFVLSTETFAYLQALCVAKEADEKKQIIALDDDDDDGDDDANRDEDEDEDEERVRDMSPHPEDFYDDDDYDVDLF
jgi:hypothetical protein